jgi:phosphatidylglycerol lysyltransferase
MDDSDFHTEFSLPTAMHYTVDQFNITTSHPLSPHTKRARLFLDTLSLVSSVAVLYALINLFQPLRARFADHTAERTRLLGLLERYGGRSEEFFKVWPHDKQYYFSNDHSSVISFHCTNGVALCLGSPTGDRDTFKSLMTNFSTLCFGNDWLPAYVHIEDDYQDLYDELGFSLQKIGQEAIVNLNKFQTETIKSKYFRQIINKFNKNQYSYEILSPPHHNAVVDRLETISNEWLSKGGRDERGFAMGYFTQEYIQLCRVLVVRDAADTIQAFLNILPADFDKEEATFDMLRHSNSALGNVNDYLLIGLIEKLADEGYLRLNLGLCPLVGLKEEGADSEKNSLINSFLSFAYANGDRFYSFQGLHKFKAKYEPEWRDRLVAYQGGLRGFTRTMTALMRAMRLKKPAL